MRIQRPLRSWGSRFPSRVLYVELTESLPMGEGFILRIQGVVNLTGLSSGIDSVLVARDAPADTLGLFEREASSRAWGTKVAPTSAAFRITGQESRGLPVSDPRRSIPSVDRLLETSPFLALQERFSRERVTGRLREELERVRERLARGGGAVDTDDVVRFARVVGEALSREEDPTLLPVVNATGVVLHTNLGRAPLSQSAIGAMARVGAGYSNLEFDLGGGVRGSRYHHCSALLTELTGAEAALVVNNNAAALVLALNTLARGRTVLVSRGELVEIGGSFRIPEILERSGAELQEVGSTNRTRLADYRSSLDAGVGAILKVHRSNFRIMGFTEEALLPELAGLAREAGVPLLHDLGSGLLVDPESLGLPHEPRPTELLAAGADVVVFSGDKLLGGPQAGVVVGGREPLFLMRKNPLCRALRVDKVTLAGLGATLSLYREPERALAEIPALALLSAPLDTLAVRSEAVAVSLRSLGEDALACPGSAVVGGGTYPGVELPSWTVCVTPRSTESADDLARRLRAASRAVVGRVEDGKVILDMRAVFPVEDDVLIDAFRDVRTTGTELEA